MKNPGVGNGGQKNNASGRNVGGSRASAAGPVVGWADLRQRLVSAVVMLAVGAVALWQGGMVFSLFVAFICAAGIWELLRILHPGAPYLRGVLLAIASGGVIALSFHVDFWTLVLLLGVIAGASGGWLAGTCDTAAEAGAEVGNQPDEKRTATRALAAPGPATGKTRIGIVIGGMLSMLIAGACVIGIRSEPAGAMITVWLMMVVTATDTGAYFGGRLIGGPRVFPRVSPHKTWAGIFSGALCAAVAGLLFTALTGSRWDMVVFALGISLIAQFGDFVVSAGKRATGLEDTSRLLPGHGGIWDRFDGYVASALALCALSQWAGFGFQPP